MAEKDGVKTIVLRSGPLKAPGQFGEKINEDQIKSLQNMINEFGATFAESVQAMRGLTDKQMEPIKTGEI